MKPGVCLHHRTLLSSWGQVGTVHQPLQSLPWPRALEQRGTGPVTPFASPHRLDLAAWRGGEDKLLVTHPIPRGWFRDLGSLLRPTGKRRPLVVARFSSSRKDRWFVDQASG